MPSCGKPWPTPPAAPGFLVAARNEGEVCVCELTQPPGLTQPTISHSFKILAAAGIFTRDKRGVRACHALVPGP